MKQDCLSLIAALHQKSPSLRRMLAWHLATGEEGQDPVAVVVGDGVFPVPRSEAIRVLVREASPLAEPLRAAPDAGYFWVLKYPFGTRGKPVLHQHPADLSSLSVCPEASPAQAQYLDVLLVAAGPQLREVLRGSLSGGALDTLRPHEVAVFLNDTGPGLVASQTLRTLLCTYGYFREAMLMKTAPREGHLWVWISSGQLGGTAGLRQLAITAPAISPHEPGPQ